MIDFQNHCIQINDKFDPSGSADILYIVYTP